MITCVWRPFAVPMQTLEAENPNFNPAFPSAVNPVLRPPVRANRVWLENEDAFATVDVANASYALMLRLLAYSYTVRRPAPEKGLAIDIAMGLMRAIIASRGARGAAARGAVEPGLQRRHVVHRASRCCADAAGRECQHFFTERLAELAAGAARLAECGDPRTVTAARMIGDLARRGARGFGSAANGVASAQPASVAPVAAAASAAGRR